MCNLHQLNMTHAPRQKFGYLDIKQSAKVRPRKLKSWRRRWVVLTQLSSLSGNECVAKFDLYDTEQKWRSNSFDKETFVLENVTSIKTAPSRTHTHAFEVVENQPVLVISGGSEFDSYGWILALQQIFTPEQIPTSKGCYKVQILANEYSSQWNLSGNFIMSVSPTCVRLDDSEGTCVISWALSTIIKFKVDKHPVTGKMTVLVLENGPNAPTGQSVFLFQSDEAEDILCAIRQSICQAQTQIQQARSGTSPRLHKLRGAVSEGSIHNLLDNHHVFPLKKLLRSESESSNPTINHESLNIPKGNSGSPLLSLGRSHLNTDLGLLAEAEENMHVGSAQLDEKDNWPHKITTEGEIREQVQSRSCSHPRKTFRSNSDYNKIKEETPIETRRNSYSCESSRQDIERLRSISAVIALMKTSCDHKPRRTVSFENDKDNKADSDSAISSMVLSVANDDIPCTDMQCCKDLNCAHRNHQLLLDREKSSSTPDLHTHWKRPGEVSGFENVYEDLDELTCTLRRCHKKQDSDTPPALPARPLSMSCITNTDYSSKSTSIKQRKSILKKNEKCISTEVKHFARESKGTNVRDQKTGSQSDHTHSSVSEGDKVLHKMKSGRKNSNKQKVLGGSCWYIDDINNRIIPELQLVKRRSSVVDTLGVACTTDGFNSKANSLPSHGKDSQRLLVSISQTKNMANNNKDETNPGVIATALRPILKPVKSRSSNPLISFFLEDTNFESHPMVTGRLPNHSRSLSSNHNILSKGTKLCSFPQIPNSNPNQELRFNEFHTEPSRNPLFTTSSNLISSLDNWSVDEMKNRYNSMGRDASVTPIYSSPSPVDPITSNQQKGHYRSYENINTHDNYMAMHAKSKSSTASMNNNITETMNSFAVNSCDLEQLTSIVKQVEGIYIHSNVVPLLLMQQLNDSAVLTNHSVN